MKKMMMLMLPCVMLLTFQINIALHCLCKHFRKGLFKRNPHSLSLIERGNNTRNQRVFKHTQRKKRPPNQIS